MAVAPNPKLPRSVRPSDHQQALALAQQQARLSAPWRSALPVETALAKSTELSRLSEIAALSQRCWAIACKRLPVDLAQSTQPAGITEGQWTWLARSSAIAAKLKVYAPDVLAELRSHGVLLEGIRIKVSRT